MAEPVYIASLVAVCILPYTALYSYSYLPVYQGVCSAGSIQEVLMDHG